MRITLIFFFSHSDIQAVLHPRYKTEYFKQKDWPSEWVSNAVDIARKIWRERYHRPQPQPSTTTTTSKTRKRLFDAFDGFEDNTSPGASDAFEAFICSPTIKTVKDPLKYWDAQLKAQADGGLARFAIDYLSAPGM